MSHADAIAVAQSMRDFISRIDAIMRYIADCTSNSDVQGLLAKLQIDLKAIEDRPAEDETPASYLRDAAANALTRIEELDMDNPPSWLNDLYSARVDFVDMHRQLESQFPGLP